MIPRNEHGDEGHSTKTGRNVAMMREDSLILPSTALERVKETNDLFRDI